MSTSNNSTAVLSHWWSFTRGDVDATISQVGFNLAQMLIPVALLIPVGIGTSFSMTHLVPGYALGFLVGSLGLTALAVVLRRKEHRDDVTVHVYGNNVPAILAYTLLIVLPVFLKTHDATRAWETAAGAVILTGAIKLVAAPFAALITKLIPGPAVMTVFGAAMYSYLAMVLLQRLFDQPIVGLIALGIVAATELARLPITPWRVPPFLAAWLIPLAVAIGIGYVHPIWTGLSATTPFVESWGPLKGVGHALDYLPVIVPMSIYLILQAIASNEAAAASGDRYSVVSVLAFDGLGTLVCGLAGSIVSPVVYALHPSYKADGARSSFTFWSGVILIVIVAAGLTTTISKLFPWPILSALIAYVAIGVGMATMHRVDAKYYSAVLLGLVLPIGAVVTSAVTSAMTAVHLQTTTPSVDAALNSTIYWHSLQGLGSGFLFLVLVVAALIVELIDRRFTAAALWALLAAAFSWVGLLHASKLAWGAEPKYAIGWLAVAFIAFTARWWTIPRTDRAPAPSLPAVDPADAEPAPPLQETPGLTRT